MINLVNKNNIITPARPTISIDTVKSGVLYAIHHCYLTSFSDDDHEERKVQLAHDIYSGYHTGIDAYDLAKHLEKNQWSIDADVVEDLTEILAHIHKAQLRAESDWQKAYSPQPPQPVGSETITGRIVDIDDCRAATYLVKNKDCPPNTHSLVKFEEVIPKLTVGDVVEPVAPSYRLRSGSNEYAMAVVVSLEPLVLVSVEADMRWESSIKPFMFRVIGDADEKQLEICMSRLKE